MKCMKCILCNSEFDVVYSGSGGHNRVFCYSCVPMVSDRKERNKQRHELILLYFSNLKLSRGCSICGYNKCAKALEWHHVDSEDKDLEVSAFISKGNLVRALEEIEKCEVLCANCHREEHERLNRDVA